MATSTETTQTTAPRVFISYSREPAEFLPWVRKLATELRGKGIDIIFDEWHLPLGGDSTVFMEQSVQAADRVLVVCTDSYVEKSERRRGGSGYEAMIITGELIKDLGTEKFVPVIPPGASGKRPSYLNTRRFIDFRSPAVWDETLQVLLLELHGISSVPPLGPNPFATGGASGGNWAASPKKGHADAVLAHEVPPRETYLAMSTYNVLPATGEIAATVLVVTDEPRVLGPRVAGWRERLARDPLIPAAARARLQSAALELLVDDAAARSRMLDWLSVTQFSGYFYYAKRAECAALDDAQLAQKLYVEPLLHRLSKKGERIMRAQSDVAGFDSFVADAIAGVKAKYRREVTPPQTSGRDLASVLELARLIAWATVCHLERPEDASASTTFESLRTRIRFAQNVMTGETHTRDDNPLP